MTKILGLTGGIASGKSTVSKYFASLNIPIIDADLVAREVMRAGSPAVKDIREQFGEEVLLENGEINREYLGELVFTYPKKRKQLNEIVQGRIRTEIADQTKALLEKTPPLIILDIPLLYEETYETEVDEVMVVYVDVDVQKERLLKRNTDLTEEDALNRILSQIPLAEKAKLADVLIDNNGTIEQTLAQVRDWLKTTAPEIEVAE
ncbi:dephospho-CoA kinase [Carnobacteriaceae bacterium 52-44]